jgi:hypothetical protein
MLRWVLHQCHEQSRALWVLREHLPRWQLDMLWDRMREPHERSEQLWQLRHHLFGHREHLRE